MPRITGVPRERAGLFARFAYRFAERLVGRLPEPMTIQAHHGQIFSAVSGFEFFLGRARRLPKRLQALAAIKAAMQIGCPF